MMRKTNVHEWFAKNGWKPFAFQEEAWQAYLNGKNGLVHAPTGTGKTYSVLMGPVIEWLNEGKSRTTHQPLTVLWITPLRALTADIAEAIRKAIEGIDIPWTVETRTGDTPTSLRTKQRKTLPTILVTTPESLSLLLTYPDTKERFNSLKLVVVDEWHELLSSKRGTLTELALARLRIWNSALRTWALSASIGNLEEAMHVLVGGRPGKLITSEIERKIELTTLLPSSIERFPWSGHLGFKLLPDVIKAIEKSISTLLFTNTRAQSELWYQAILSLRPQWSEHLAIHHGSIDRTLRVEAEGGLRTGRLKCVVATSSLDLGVDFSPVDQVIQIGSPKGVARLLQRAGRSGHRPGVASKIVCVPTNAFELVEFAAARYLLGRREIESRRPLPKPLDVLVQHIVSTALAGGFVEEDLKTEVRTAYSYRDLTDEEWRWAMDFAHRGGESLKAYPEYNRIIESGGKFVVGSKIVAKFHRMSVGTIASDQMMHLKFVKGGSLGSIEEGFIARLRPKEKFIFGGKPLELVRVKEMTAYVRLASSVKGSVPRWQGGRMPLSSELAHGVKHKLYDASLGVVDDPELDALSPLIGLQLKWSRLPKANELLIEATKDRQGYHVFVFPFAGRSAHGGLAALVAYRITKLSKISISHAITDYGFELLSGDPLPTDSNEWRALLSPDNLLEDILLAMNANELARRQFREIARVAGLIFSGYPGKPKNARQIQASSGLFYDVFSQYDPNNLLLVQARREVLERELEFTRIKASLEEISRQEIMIVQTERFTPLAFPIWAERIHGQVSSESWSERVKKMAEQLEARAVKESTPKSKKR
jgi:ATP-dependent helicase Lhr and Lhr-like helicase